MFKQDPTQRVPWAPTRVNLLTIHLGREGGQGRNHPDETGLVKSWGGGGEGGLKGRGGGLERHLSTTTELGLQEATRKVVLHLFCWCGEGCGTKGKGRGGGDGVWGWGGRRRDNGGRVVCVGDGGGAETRRSTSQFSADPVRLVGFSGRQLH